MLLVIQPTLAQKTYKVSGFVEDKFTQEALISANIVDIESGKGTFTNNYGYFSLLVKDSVKLKVSFVGYQTILLPINQFSDTLVRILLEPENEISEVEIIGQREYRNNLIELSGREIQNISAIGGKVDLSKTLQLLPGVGTLSEGSSTLIIRGGEPGQNLYLFDNVPIIHVNHLGGFFSVFNPDIINNVQLYKGGIPAKFGGKISSVMNITQKEGNKSEFKGNLSLGLTDASFSLEGPVSSKMSYIIAARKTMIDPIMYLMSSLSDGGQYSLFYGFHDINFKLTWKPNIRNTINALLYYGDDYLRYKSSLDENNVAQSATYLNIWGNWLSSVHWKSVLKDDLFMNMVISSSRYRLMNKNEQQYSDQVNSFNFSSESGSTVNNFRYLGDINKTIIKNWSVSTGIEFNYKQYVPVYNDFTTKNSISTADGNIFLHNEIKISKFLYLEPGIRFNTYKNNDFFAYSIEPRITINVNLPYNQTLSADYMRIKQYEHLFFTQGDISNNEVWIPSDEKILPIDLNQLSAGYTKIFSQGKYILNISAYLKEMSQLANYAEGYSTFINDLNWYSRLLTSGKGFSKGVEIQAKKNTGVLNASLSYTLSKTTREYPLINNGKLYLYDYDRLHSFSIQMNYKLNTHLRFNILWIYQSGLPYTPAIGKQLVFSEQENQNGESFYYEALIYGEKNSARMLDYHRLDISTQYEYMNRKGRNTIWTFSVYNLYNRKNPYHYYYNTNSSSEIYIAELGENVSDLKLYQITYFPIFPSVSYKVFFDKNGLTRKLNKANFIQKMNKWLFYENKENED